MRGLASGRAALLAGLLLCSDPAPSDAQNNADLHLVGSTVAQPLPGAWLSQSLAITVRDGEGRLPRVATEFTLAEDRLQVASAYADLGGPTVALRLGRFRVPIGRANTLAIGEDALVTRPIWLDSAFSGSLSATGALVTVAGGGLSLRGGLAEGSNPFFGGGQIGILRGAWLTSLPGGSAFEVGTSGTTNQIAGLAGVDATLALRGGDDFGLVLGVEGMGGHGGWAGGSGLAAVGHGLAGFGWGPLEAALRIDMGAGTDRSGALEPARPQGFAVAYGLRIAPRALIRLEMSRRADSTVWYDGLSGERLLAQVVFALGGPQEGDVTAGVEPPP